MVNLRSQAYRWTDLTQLSFDALREKTGEIRLSDGRDNYKYLCALFAGATRASITEDEKKSRQDEFVLKIFHLIDLLDTERSKYYYFHALVRISASVFQQKYERVTYRSKHAAAKANYRVLEMVEKCFIPQPAGPPLSLSYYDFATAYRRLWSAWQESCERDRLDEKHNAITCWHKQNGLLLSFIHKKAYSEIRANIMLTAGTQLPLELAEKVFNLTMEAEDVPRHSIMREAEDVDILVPQAVQKRYGEGAVRRITVMRLLWEYCACERAHIESRGGY